MKKSTPKQRQFEERQLQTQMPLHKTTVPQKPTTQTQIYNVRPSSGIKIETAKNLPPRGPKQKIQYLAENNMTESRIQQARNGLQLLKKKLSQKGLSRQKPKSETVQKHQTLHRTTNPNNLQNDQLNQTKTNTKSQIKQTISENSPKNGNVGMKKQIQTFKSEQYINDKVPNNQYVNEVQEIQIKPKQDFFKLLEREMKKQNMNLNTNKTEINKKYEMEQKQEVELAQCSKGCGRMFNFNALVKHEKICEKVFQSKRKAFDSAQHRQLEEEFSKPPQQPEIKSKKIIKQQQKPTTSKIPKWKLQSASFRAGLKATTNKPLTKQEKAVVDMQKQLLMLCNYCGRRFNNNAGLRHIPFCQAKAKQIPKMNTTMKKKK